MKQNDVFIITESPMNIESVTDLVGTKAHSNIGTKWKKDKIILIYCF